MFDQKKNGSGYWQVFFLMIMTLLLLFAFSCGDDSKPLDNEENGAGGNGSTAEKCVDNDKDGFGVNENGQCPKRGVDCNDKEANIYPGAQETCGNGVDEDCDGNDQICEQSCNDYDNDGYGFSGVNCPKTGTDCNDSNPQVNPGVEEICGNGVDDDCQNGDKTCQGACVDNDQDGYGVLGACPKEGLDCNDADSAINPSAKEVCGNGIDDDCKDGDSLCPDHCIDLDGDGYGTSGKCTKTELDCNDYDEKIYPGASEVCGNDKDDDCKDGDQKCSQDCIDNDQDGYGQSSKDCPRQEIDCDDTDPAVNPGRAEVCGDGVDQDCNGKDKVCPKDCVDADGDGYGIGKDCLGTDCDDTNVAVYPGAAEICSDNIDQNCDGADRPCPKDCQDADEDGYGTGSDCLGTDCDDNDLSINPGANEICGDNTDQDCDGKDTVCPVTCTDKDQDGYCQEGDSSGAKKDCDDNNLDVYPGAREVCGDNVDQDCSGSDKKCPPICQDDSGCPLGQICVKDGTSFYCKAPKVWEYYAPTFYVDTYTSQPGVDRFAALNFDNDKDGMNNYNNWSKFQSSAKPTVYVSFIKSETHYFLGYWLYFARACSGYPLIKTMNCMSKQSNIMTGVLLVVRHQNQGGLGTLEYMQTIAWDDSQHYLPAGSQLKLMGGMATIKGDIQFEDGKKRSPLIFVRHGDHAAFGDKSFTAGIGHWHKDGFPENSGIIYRYFSGNSKTPSDDNDPSARYQMKFLYNDLWSLRKNFGSNNMFSTFGILRTSKSDNQNIAPWAYKDTDYGHRPRGEIFYNPIDLIRHEFPMGWTNFSFKYLYNPYALRLELEKLTVLKDNDIGIGVGESDPFIAIYAFDRDGKEYRILGDRSQIKVSSNYGYRIDAMQNTWRKDDVKANTVLDLGKEMGRNYFYYLKVPNFSHFNLAVREYDAMTLNDWLMDPELQHREKSSIPGQVQRSLDFIESKLEFKYGCVTGSNCQ